MTVKLPTNSYHLKCYSDPKSKTLCDMISSDNMHLEIQMQSWRTALVSLHAVAKLTMFIEWRKQTLNFSGSLSWWTPGRDAAYIMMVKLFCSLLKFLFPADLWSGAYKKAGNLRSYLQIKCFRKQSLDTFWKHKHPELFCCFCGILHFQQLKVSQTV